MSKKSQRKHIVPFAISALIGFLLLIGVSCTSTHPQGTSGIQPGETVAERSSLTAQPVAYAEKYFYAGIPKTTTAYPHPLLVLTNMGYVVGYDETRKDPAWVCYRVFKVSNLTPPPRPKSFVVDNRTHSKVTTKDYTGSGYDRGHCAPNRAIGICYGAQAQLETFLMSNIHPQRSNLNQRIWERLEEKEIIDYAQRLETIWVITGGVYSETPEKLSSGIEVPEACYKILVDEVNKRPRVMAFVIPQTVKGDEAFEPFLVSVDEIEKKTGLDFMSELPDEIERMLEAGKAKKVW